MWRPLGLLFLVGACGGEPPVSTVSDQEVITSGDASGSEDGESELEVTSGGDVEVDTPEVVEVDASRVAGPPDTLGADSATGADGTDGHMASDASDAGGGGAALDVAVLDGASPDASAEEWSTEGWPETCMGSASYCARPYNQLSQVCTHNAMANGEDGFTIPAPNQAYSFTRQLDDGVRCLMLDTYEAFGEPYLCHGVCGIWGQRPLADGLEEIAAWMTAHPQEVVTFILQSNISEAAMHQSLVDAGLADASGAPTADDPLYFHDAPPGSPWPPIGWMLAQNQRLVVFTDDAAANGSWHLDWRVYGWETPYDDPTFTCSPGRGDPTAYDHQVFILNHYTLCVQGGCTATSIVNNAYDFALERAIGCWAVDADSNPWGQIPTFVNVDNYHTPTDGAAGGVPDIVEVVEALNAFWPTPP